MHKLVFTYACEFQKENELGALENKNIIFSGNINAQVRYKANESFISFAEYLDSATDSDENIDVLISELSNKDKIKNINFYYIENENKYFLHHFDTINQVSAILKVLDSTEVAYANIDFKLCKIFEVK